MTEESSKHLPIEINLHAKSRLLSIAFEDGSRFELPCEYLRVFSKAASLDASILGKEGVSIERIEPQGQYAIRIVFTDGHDTGIYSWDTLYTLGVNQQANWAEYLKRLESLGYQRQEPEGTNRRIRLLYFSWLARKMRKEADEVTLPAGVTDVTSLLSWLGQRRQGAEGFTRLHEGDEVGLVPNSPTPPATPDLI